MTKMLARESADGLSLEAVDLQLSDLQSAYPNRIWSTPFVAAQLDGTNFVLIDVPEQPALEFHQRAVRQFAKTGDAWVCSWDVQLRGTAAEIKAELRALAMEKAMQKRAEFLPTAAQWQSAGYSLEATLAARSAQIDTKLQQVMTDIQAASTAADAVAIYNELVAI